MLSAWFSFYALLGASAGALTGLVFIVVTLVRDRSGASAMGFSTFTTPTVVHFACALFISATMSAPFGSLVPLAVILGCAGLAGVVYVMRVALLATKLETYRPDAEDWFFNVLLPLLAYVLLLGGAVFLPSAPSGALYAPAGAVMLLILIGIRNAWDVVTFVALGKMDELPDHPPPSGPADGR
jgi:hypothetical protein